MISLFRPMAILAFSALLLAPACKSSSPHTHDHHSDDHGHAHHNGEHEAHGEPTSKGPHGGWFFSEESFTFELTIFEEGVAPHFLAYATRNGEPVVSDSLEASVTLKRLGEKPVVYALQPAGNFLVGNDEIREPHSFDAEISVSTDGRNFKWKFSQHEGRTEIPDDIAKHSGIQVDKPQARTIETTMRLRGRVTPSEHRIAHITPRFPGMVREGRKHIGDSVQKGEVLAIVESNQSLQPFEVRSQIAGTVINGHVIVGEFVPENEWIYIVADTSEVWIDFARPLSQTLTASKGDLIRILTSDGQVAATSPVSYIAPYADERSQSQLIRVEVPNPEGRLLPGMFVVGDLVVSKDSVPIAVRESALQTFRDWRVVFIKDGTSYEARPVELGRSDGEWTEVLSGLSSDDDYVVENPFLVKADVLKHGATHDH